jgi:hypothetical protein
MGDADVRTPVGFGRAAQWGLGSLLIGCTVLLASCVTMVFNVQVFHGGPSGIHTALAFVGGLIGVTAVAALGIASLVFGIRGWQLSYTDRSSPAFGIAGTAASAIGLITWLIAGIDLIAILQSFVR